MCRLHTRRATRNEHDWTCSVPWLVFLLCVKTLQMTMTMIRDVETMKQMSGSTCPVTAVLSKQATHAPRLKAHTTATSAVAIQRPFSLKCRHVLRDLDRVKSGSTANDGCAKKVTKNTQKSANGSDHAVL